MLGDLKRRVKRSAAFRSKGKTTTMRAPAYKRDGEQNLSESSREFQAKWSPCEGDSGLTIRVCRGSLVAVRGTAGGMRWHEEGCRSSAPRFASPQTALMSRMSLRHGCCSSSLTSRRTAAVRFRPATNALRRSVPSPASSPAATRRASPGACRSAPSLRRRRRRCRSPG